MDFLSFLTPYIGTIDGAFVAALLGIIWIDLLLSGDNAIVIALVCRQLPKDQQRMGMILGSGAAVGLRIVFAVFITYLMLIPGLAALGGLFLLWVAIGLVRQGGHDSHDLKPSTTLAGAIATIAIADVGMSLDNVMAIAAMSHGSVVLLALGVLISIPMVIAGSVLFTKIIERFPVIALAGAALLGWLGGSILSNDPYVKSFAAGVDPQVFHYGLAGGGLALVLLVAWIIKVRSNVAVAA